jgi:hypothetical protein
MMDERRKDILVGQACNMAVEMLKYKGFNPDDRDTFRAKFKEYTKFFFDLNVEANEELLSQKKGETKSQEAGNQKPCPKCGEPIGKSWTKHFACGWDA